MADYQVTQRSITEYTPAQTNPNKGSERGLAIIENSLTAFGAGRSLVADRDDELIAGSHTVEAAINRGFTKVLEIETDGDTLIVHKRRDLDLTDDARAQGLQIADNRSTQLGYVPDEEVLADRLQALREADPAKVYAAGFNASEAAFLQAMRQREGVSSTYDQAVEAQAQHIREHDAAPEIPITPELFERHDYILFYFDNDLDWTVIEQKLVRQMRNVPVATSSISAQKKGKDRVISGQVLLELLSHVG